LSNSIYRDLLGKPFKLGGHGPDYYDCGGLVKEILTRLGQPPLDFSSLVSIRAREGEIEQALLGFESIDNIDPPCVLAFYNEHGFVAHAGVALSKDWFIHTCKSVGYVNLERLSEDWICRIAKIYKLKSA